MPVAELQHRMSSREFAEWMAFAQMEPFGEARADLRNAMLMALIANTNRDPKKHKEPFEVSDFMLKFEDEKEPISEEDAIAAIDAAFTAYAVASGGARGAQGAKGSKGAKGDRG